MNEKRLRLLREAAKKGGLTTARIRRESALRQYYENPSACINCGNTIYVKDNERPCMARKRKFCNNSCAASYNNSKRKTVRTHSCSFCGEQTANPKYCNSRCATKDKDRQRWKKFDDSEILSGYTRTIKRYLIDRRGDRCEICGLEEWKATKIPLVLDHINGNYTDNTKKNLRLVCPNCDALLPTYKGRNLGHGRYSRRKRYKDGKSY